MANFVFQKGLSGPIRKIKDPRNENEIDIVRSYFRYIIFLAKKYVRPRVELEDLVAEGLIGLLDAIKRFDPKRATNDNSFHHLAIVRINGQMYEYFLSNNPAFTVPNYISRAMSLVEQIRSHVEEYQEGSEAETTIANFSAPEFENSAPKEVVEQVAVLKIKLQKLAKSSEHSYEEMADTVLSTERDFRNIGTGSEEEISSNEEKIVEQDFLNKFLDNLVPKTRKVVEMSLKGESLEEIGDACGFTRERARQLRDGALDYLWNTKMYKDAK